MAKIVFATRPSKLARWQTQHVMSLLENYWTDLSCEEIIITTQGDKILDRPLPEIGGKGMFTFELEEALRAGEVHAAVHSLKDLPTENPPGLTIGAIPQRAPINDVLIFPKGHTLDQLPSGAVVGTSSLRRQAQLLAYRSDLKTRSIRGNVDTRIRKVQEGHYDAIILAAAGVVRLRLEEHITQYISPEIMLPAPGQGALAIQCRVDDHETLRFLHALEDKAVRQEITAEREFLAALGGGCSIPVGAYAQMEEEKIHCKAVVVSPDGSKALNLSDSDIDATKLGRRLAAEALSLGAQEVMHG